VTFEEYLAVETGNAARRAALNGAVHAMAGATVVPSRITLELARDLAGRPVSGVPAGWNGARLDRAEEPPVYASSTN
jgi:hypothetical protein